MTLCLIIQMECPSPVDSDCIYEYQTIQVTLHTQFIDSYTILCITLFIRYAAMSSNIRCNLSQEDSSERNDSGGDGWIKDRA